MPGRRLVVRVFGRELLTVETGPSGADEYDGAGDLSGGSLGSMPVGFTASPGDQRWERGVEQ